MAPQHLEQMRMSKSYVTGFPRIGERRELKFALEAYWAGRSDFERVRAVGRDLRIRHLKYQQDAGIDYISVNDFSYYDQMLDLVYALGAAPERFKGLRGERLYFAMACGEDEREAMEMTKWFNTNYHYIVPELAASASFTPDASKIESEYREARELGIRPKVDLIGPITFLALSKKPGRLRRVLPPGIPREGLPCHAQLHRRARQRKPGARAA